MNAIEEFSGTASLNKFNMRSEIVGGEKKRCFFHFMVDIKFHELCECLN